MPKINMLDKSVYELIAAGEVIERPASVIKELAENAIDAEAKNITVEIRRGGISYIRITDDGSGIPYEEVPSAFARHATSKVLYAEDLNRINTLGFRGEALASICAVGRVEINTKPVSEKFGTVYRIEGSETAEYDHTGCADGTTIIVRDLFFNTPARLKFLKKDVFEGNCCSSVIEKLALSHPNISFRFIRDGKQTLLTSGDGEYYSAIYAVYGKQFAAGMIPVDNIFRDIGVTGYVSSPLFTRSNRSLQNFFVNGRSVKSDICSEALEEAFRNNIMAGKFPSCVLMVNLDPSKMDANIHPAKAEVRFTEEKIVYDAVYFAVKNAVMGYDESREIKIPSAADKERPVKIIKEVPPSTLPIPSAPSYKKAEEIPEASEFYNEPEEPVQSYISPEFKPPEKPAQKEPDISDYVGFSYLTNKSFEKKEVPKAEEKPYVPEKIVFIGEIFKTYILCESKDSLIIIDKHAAHERINFEKLKSGLDISAQYLIEPCVLTLSAEEFNALNEYSEKLSQAGIILEFCDNKVRVTALPQMLDREKPSDIVENIAALLVNGNTNAEGELFDDILHTVACKASIRANDITDPKELNALAQEVISRKEIRYCPHGRPIVTQISKRQIEKNFGRT